MINKNTHIILFLLIILAFYSCAGNANSEKANNIQPEKAEGRKEFVIPSIPQNLTTMKDRANYLASHYWDDFDFTDTTYTQGLTEKAMIGYIEILPVAEKDIANTSIKIMLKNTEVKPAMRTYFLSLFKSYLYDPNSPLRNEELYIPVLEYITNSAQSDSTDVVRAKFDLNMAFKNREGYGATDITYTLASGKKGTLYSIKGDYTIILFYNPDCEACAEVIMQIKKSQILNIALQNNLVNILTFYPDADIQIWKNHINDIPRNWINGYDKERIVETKKLYDLKAIPTLYLLNRNKKVLLKDTHVNIIEKYLADNNPMIFVR